MEPHTLRHINWPYKDKEPKYLCELCGEILELCDIEKHRKECHIEVICMDEFITTEY